MQTTSFNSSHLIVVDAVPENELQTALNLYRDLRDLPESVLSRSSLRHISCGKSSQFLEALQALASECAGRKIRPILHIEGHGNRQALFFPDGTGLAWQEVFEVFRRINLACANNLLVTSGACESAWSYTYELAPFDRPCPVFGLIAPPEEVTAGVVRDTFKAFYKTLLTSGSMEDALQATLKHSPNKTLSLVFAEFMFGKSAEIYIKEHCMGRGLYERQENLVTRLKLESGLSPQFSRKRVRSELRRPQAPYLAEQYRQFMHIDAHPENAERFSMDMVKFEQEVKMGRR